MKTARDFAPETKLKKTPLSRRVTNCLFNNGIETVGQLIAVANGGEFKIHKIIWLGSSFGSRRELVITVKGQSGLLRMANFGMRSLKEVLEFCDVEDSIEKEKLKNISQSAINGYVSLLKKHGFVVYKKRSRE